MFCPYCGNSFEEGARRCPQCDRPLVGPSLTVVSSKFFASDGAVQAAHLSDVICDALRDMGPAAFDQPRRLVSYVMDSVDEDDRIARTFANNCDMEFISFYADAWRQNTAEAVEVAALRATELLHGARFVQERMARAVSQAVALGVALDLGLEVSFPEDEPDGPNDNGTSEAPVPEAPKASDGIPPPRKKAVSPGHRSSRVAYCVWCGAKCLRSDKFCTTCGRSVDGTAYEDMQPEESKLPIVAAFLTALAILLIAAVLALA